MRVGFAYRRAPVAQPEADTIVSGHGAREVHKPFHVLVVILQDARVPGVQVHVPGDVRQGGIPRRAAAPVVAPSAGRRDSRDLAIGTLNVGDVVHPLGICGCRRIVQEHLLGRERCVTGPWALLPVGAIGGKAVKVAHGRPPGGLLNPVEKLV